ncbi:hypothetical protein SAY86_020948 [Trapa natans]|uniref:C2H2-type domain-containing protein n=1 Tax=Trapa natans TaxID=22666 RepID=A0AAN7RJK4_TRANT|nr:hypothetical protein SAY86_020948 [Trapa natans]
MLPTVRKILIGAVRKILSSFWDENLSHVKSHIYDPSRYYHCNLRSVYRFSESHSGSIPKSDRTNVAIFWDLDNKPPNTVPLFIAASKLKTTAFSFGSVRLMVAYGKSQQLNCVEKKGSIKTSEVFSCRVCNRKFSTNEKLVNHFRQIHESEHQKRLNQIESARGTRRVKLVGRYSMNMEKYRNAARYILTPVVGYKLGDELKRAGFWVQTSSHEPQKANIALKNHMVETMDRRQADCIVLVSDDMDFLEVLKEAKRRCVKTVVVGDVSDGTLKRAADTGFSWKEVLLGKAKKEAVSVLRRWKDRDILKRLEWIYDPKVDSKWYEFDEDTSVENGIDAREDDARVWWKLDKDTYAAST